MPPTPWRPLIVHSRVLGPAGNLVRDIEELAGQPGLHGVLLSALALTDDPEAVLKAKKKARLKLYLEPREFYEFNAARIVAHYQALGVDGLVISCMHRPEVFASLMATATTLKLILSTEDVGRFYSSVQDDVATAFRNVLGQHAFDGAWFAERDLNEMPKPRGRGPVMCARKIRQIEDASGALSRGATHLVANASLFGSTRAYVDRLWDHIKESRGKHERR